MRRYFNMFRPDVLALYKIMMAGIKADPYTWNHDICGKSMSHIGSGALVSLSIFSPYHRIRLTRRFKNAHASMRILSPPKPDKLKSFIEDTHIQMTQPGWPLEDGIMYQVTGREITVQDQQGGHTRIPQGDCFLLLNYVHERQFKILYKSQAYELYIDGAGAEACLEKVKGQE